MECPGPQTRKHKDWLGEHCTKIQHLLEEKRRVCKASLDDPKSTAKKDALKTARSNIQRKLREMQNSWLSSKADEIQGFADRNDMKNFYHSLKEVYGPTSTGRSPLLSADGSTLITHKGP